MANVDGFIDDNGNSFDCVDKTARESISRCMPSTPSLSVDFAFPTDTNYTEIRFKRDDVVSRVLSIRDSELVYFKVENGVYTRLWTK